MLAESGTMNSPNPQNKIRNILRYDFLQATNIRPGDPILTIYEDDQIIIKKQEKDSGVIDDLLVYRERMKDYEKFYISLEKDVVDYIGKGERKGAVRIDNLLSEVRNELPGIEIDKKMFLNGMMIYFKKKDIRLVRSADMESFIFKADNKEKKDDNKDKTVIKEE